MLMLLDLFLLRIVSLQSRLFIHWCFFTCWSLFENADQYSLDRHKQGRIFSMDEFHLQNWCKQYRKCSPPQGSAWTWKNRRYYEQT